ncbi:MAG: PrsW family intramembrane metalloprotease [Armatimonadetes bacterium]|nr:PrsW family intramembrane metalloprotease [Armatimonadota bacterium]
MQTNDPFKKGIYDLREEFRMVRLDTVIPLSSWLKSRPWNTAWVRWFLLYALLPLFLSRLFGARDLSQVTWAFGIYFSFTWLMVLRFFMRPENVDLRVLVKIGLFTALFGGLLVLVLDKTFLRGFVSLSDSGILPVNWIGNVFGVGLVEEAVKALPLYIFAFLPKLLYSPISFSFLGVLSGLVFGVAEGPAYSMFYEAALEGGDQVTAQLLRLISLPLLHACFGGIVGYFMGLAASHKRGSHALLALGLGLSAILHGTYNTFSGGWIGFGVAILTLLVFVSYVITGEEIAERLKGEEVTA